MRMVRPEHRRTAAEVVAPVRVGHDGDAAGRVGRPVLRVRVREAVPEGERHAQRLEELRRDAGHVLALGRADFADDGGAVAIERHARQPVDGMPALVVVRHRRAIVRDAGSRVRVVDRDEAIRLAEGKRTEEDDVHDGEYREVGADRDRERGERGGGERRLLAEDPRGVPQALLQRVERAKPARLAGVEYDVVHVAELDSRAPRGIFRRVSRRDQVLRVLLEVEPHLLGEALLEASAMEQRTGDRPQAAQHVTPRPAVARSAAAIAAASRFQSSVSSRRRFLPGAVSV